MKKILMTIAAVLCCWVTMTVFTACSEDDENEPKEYTYNISMNFGGYSWTDDGMNYNEWQAAVMGAYMTAIGVTTETFTLQGTLAECDQKVLEACQEAEKKVATLRGGTAIITVKNVTTSKTVYTYNIEPAPTPKADYAILFYGAGGSTLDRAIVQNMIQFFQGKAESYERVSIAAQYKFSTVENMIEVGVNEPFAQKYDSKTVRFVVEADQTDPETKAYQTFANSIYGETNADCTCPDSLTNFINWATKACPAKNYLLILSDHGSGYMPDGELPETGETRGIIFDDGKAAKHFTAKSLKRAIAAANARMQTIYLDACLMNCVEYQFELKDLADYLVLSTFIVPGYGGHYDFLVDQLAAHPTDIEAALKEYNRQTVAFWDERYEGRYDYHDMSVIRTAKLDAFGQKWRAFTDKIIAAYQSGEALKQKIDSVTKYTFRIINDNPSYDIVHYYKQMYRVAPEVLGEDFFNELDASFWATVVSKQTSNFLQERGNSVDASILLGTKGHYRRYTYNGDLDNLELDFFLQFEADGSRSCFYDNEYHPRSPWGGTLESTYCQLAFDKATGWSRWMLLNEQEPFPVGLSDFNYVPGTLEQDKQE
ncbi:MAG: hypothetical protein K6G92_08835 [Bacteroidaceae bacterium]|nr:hypothetical protein [Bacteroidaceae bacterium]